LDKAEQDMLNQQFVSIDSDQASYSIEYLSSWKNHVNGWLRSKSSTLLIRYEDLLQDTKNQITGMMKFLNIKPVCSMDDIISATNIRTLRKQEETYGFAEKKHGERFFREGKSSGWKNVNWDFTTIEKSFEPLMKKLKYI
jgi:hypothetical protein